MDPRFIITSNRAVDEWLSLFDDPILGNSALDRLANASYQIVIEGTSYRERQSPHRALLSNHGICSDLRGSAGYPACYRREAKYGITDATQLDPLKREQLPTMEVIDRQTTT